MHIHDTWEYVGVYMASLACGGSRTTFGLWGLNHIVMLAWQVPLPDESSSLKYQYVTLKPSTFHFNYEFLSKRDSQISGKYLVTD